MIVTKNGKGKPMANADIVLKRMIAQGVPLTVSNYITISPARKVLWTSWKAKNGAR